MPSLLEDQKTDTRSFLRSRWSTWLMLLCSLPLVSSVDAKTFVYVSAAQDGVIDSYQLDLQHGYLHPLANVSAGAQVMPMAVSPNKKHLYAVLRSQPYTVISYRIHPEHGSLQAEGKTPLPDNMATIRTDRSGRYLFSASYSGHLVACSPISSQGIVRPAQQVLPTGKNAHFIQSDWSNQYVFATNLGSNQIMEYRFNPKNGRLTANQPDRVMTPDAPGPRHLAFVPALESVYALTELSGKVIHYRLEGGSGQLRQVSVTSMLPPNSILQPGWSPEQAKQLLPANQKYDPVAMNRIWAADIKATPDGRFLYTSERTSSRIAWLSLDAKTGEPTYRGSIQTEKQPRGIGMDASGRYLIATGEKSSHLSVYRINQQTGALQLLGRYPAGKGANWVEVVSFPD